MLENCFKKESTIPDVKFIHDKAFWEKNWEIYLENYLKACPRLGIFLEYLFKDTINNILEIACGSGRDSVHLARKGKEVLAVDYEEKVIEKVKMIFQEVPNISFKVEDAFNLSFKRNTFDLSFHNGFFILFPEDEKLFQLIKEHERVTRKYLVFAVHNRLNKKLAQKFKELSALDKLYDVRFFSPEEIINITKKSGIKYKEIRIYKFGGIIDVLYQKRIKNIPNILFRVSHKIVPYLYKYLPWKYTERIVAIIKFQP